jgi:adenosine kinase
VRIAVTGSVATDHLMTFPGRFADSLVAEKLDRVSLSFLVEELQIRRGGVGANISFGMACLGLSPVLVAAVGPDFADYRAWLERHGVDCGSVQVSARRHTARFVCTTDADHNQIASFYPGAMSEAREIELDRVAERTGGLDLVLIGADDPDAMLRHTARCRALGIAFAADPSQQLARMDRLDIRWLVDGARYLFTNEYEAALTEQKTGWSSEDILDRVGTRVTTLGARGSLIESRGAEPIQVSVPRVEGTADPTGVGDAFRAGYLAGIAWELPVDRCAQIGSLLATYVIQTVGTQEYVLTRDGFLERLAEGYGESAAAEVATRLRCPRP